MSQRYPTGWAGELTFEQIAASLQAPMSHRLKLWGFFYKDIPDAIQNGLMGLWERLVLEPDFLADKTHLNTLWFVLTEARPKVFERYHRRFIPFSTINQAAGQFDDELDDFDEYLISGLGSPSVWWNAVEPWATWATETDTRIDLTSALHELVEQYTTDRSEITNLHTLIALYILTTDTDSAATMQTFNLRPSTIWDRMSRLRKVLQGMLKEYRPDQPARTWHERLRQGEVQPYLEVIDHYQDRPIALTAIYSLTTNIPPATLTPKPREQKQLHYYRHHCDLKLRAAYRRAAWKSA